MSAALQNPDNWPAIQRAAREAPAHIAALEEEMGVHMEGKIGSLERLLNPPIPDEVFVTEASPPLPWWKRAVNRVLYYVGASLFSAVLMPVPNMQLQTCLARFDGAVMEVRCDSTRVCPPGYHLDTHLNRFGGGSDLGEVFGYGDVKNTCLLGAVVHQPNQVMEVLP